jgi:hypothetical protein
MHDVQAPAGTVNLLSSCIQHTELSTPSTRNHACVPDVQPDIQQRSGLDQLSSLGSWLAFRHRRMWVAADSAQ